MTERIVDLSEEPARLSVRHKQMVIQRGEGEDKEEITVPLSELVVLVVSHPAVRYTHGALSGLCAGGGVLVLCNEKRLPTGMLLPLEGHYAQAERFAAQAQAPLPVRKRLWRQIVSEKVKAQGRLLSSLGGRDEGLSTLAKKVRSGDPENVEAQASRRYWPALFGKEFRRNPEAEDQNRLLNYGYAVLRAATARAVCAAGLHPSLGLHHHNRYDTFCLASDLMEPFRPLVDGAVAHLVQEAGPQAPLDKATKGALVSALLKRRFMLEGDSRTLFDVLARAASSLAAALEGRRQKLILPGESPNEV